MELSAVEILLVEDNPSDVDLTLHALRHNCVLNNIHVARDGEEALDFVFCRNTFARRLMDVPPRIILLDLSLPKVNGLEVLRLLKTDEQTKSIPVVMLTSSREEVTAVKASTPDADATIQKPVDFEQFREAVRQLGLHWLVVNEPRAENGLWNR